MTLRKLKMAQSPVPRRLSGQVHPKFSKRENLKIRRNVRVKIMWYKRAVPTSDETSETRLPKRVVVQKAFALARSVL